MPAQHEGELRVFADHALRLYGEAVPKRGRGIPGPTPGCGSPPAKSTSFARLQLAVGLDRCSRSEGVSASRATASKPAEFLEVPLAIDAPRGRVPADRSINPDGAVDRSASRSRPERAPDPLSRPSVSAAKANTGGGLILRREASSPTTPLCHRACAGSAVSAAWVDAGISSAGPCISTDLRRSRLSDRAAARSRARDGRSAAALDARYCPAGACGIQPRPGGTRGHGAPPSRAPRHLEWAPRFRASFLARMRANPAPPGCDCSSSFTTSARCRAPRGRGAPRLSVSRQNGVAATRARSEHRVEDDAHARCSSTRLCRSDSRRGGPRAACPEDDDRVTSTRCRGAGPSMPSTAAMPLST